MTEQEIINKIKENSPKLITSKREIKKQNKELFEKTMRRNKKK